MRPALRILLAVLQLWPAMAEQPQQEPLGVADVVDPFYERAVDLMKAVPLIDTHVDLPQIIRSLGASCPMLSNVVQCCPIYCSGR